jgi:Family of unknown function (DUF5694)
MERTVRTQIDRLLAFVLFGMFSGLALAQTDAKLLRDIRPADRPTLLVLATHHFDNPGRDAVKTDVPDILAGERQDQIASVVRQLAAFAPTHIAIEWPADQQRKLDQRYSEYRNGHYELTRSEIDQLGLRLAKEAGLSKVFGVDWNDAPTGDSKTYDWAAFAHSHGLDSVVSAIADPKSAESFAPPLTDQSIPVWLMQLNEPERLARSHRVYFDIALWGSSSEQPGANWVGHWYTRNLRIFGNLIRLTSQRDARVLVIYGQGHAYLLRQFAQESGAFRIAGVSSFVGRTAR